MKLILFRMFFVSLLTIEAEGHFLVIKIYFHWGETKMFKGFMIILE